MVATNKPITTNDSASPAASASGPARCALTAVPSTIGSSGSTQGDSVDSTPARNARPMLAISALQRLVEQALDRCRVGVAGRARLLLLALERDQRALLLDLER